MKVLLVEDSGSMRKIVTAMLKRLGYDEVFEAENGAAALQVLAQEKIDLLLTDWNMPVMDGWTLIGKVRQQRDLRRLPVLMFTTRGEKEDVVGALNAGADNYLVKPFTPPQLKSKIQAVLGDRVSDRIRRLVQNQDKLAAGNTDCPLVVFGQGVASATELATKTNEATLRYLDEAINSLRLLGVRDPRQKVGYALKNSLSSVTHLMRAYHQRVYLVLLCTDMPSNSHMTLARLLTINPPDHLSVVLVSAASGDLSTKDRRLLERTGVQVVERGLLNQTTFEALFAKHITGKFTS